MAVTVAQNKTSSLPKTTFLKTIKNTSFLEGFYPLLSLKKKLEI
jgi:hypothetical protein